MLALMTFKLPYHYKNNGHWLFYRHPTLVLDKDIMNSVDDWYGSKEHYFNANSFCNNLEAVRWSPSFRAPIGKIPTLRESGLDRWISAARLLREEFQRPSSIYQTKLEEGTCVIFDNSRVLHARKAFSGSERWLRGAYIDKTTFTQQVLTLDNTWRSDAIVLQ